ncbi:uncharacterized transmembrane protein DDB_G0289901-like [Ischnura elegans]|uniref:uncharacterized transmembrane protein DDB_G0289901-like n=1 Tax=Ischnura elegans TaxID=197161 RepID=UPI001ED8B856|nr:uncharacterized transmembrane protein DDB_G0289901-like [Ischnura elegans]
MSAGFLLLADETYERSTSRGPWKTSRRSGGEAVGKDGTRPSGHAEGAVRGRAVVSSRNPPDISGEKASREKSDDFAASNGGAGDIRVGDGAREVTKPATSPSPEGGGRVEAWLMKSEFSGEEDAGELGGNRIRVTGRHSNGDVGRKFSEMVGETMTGVEVSAAGDINARSLVGNVTKSKTTIKDVGVNGMDGGSPGGRKVGEKIERYHPKTNGVGLMVCFGRFAGRSPGNFTSGPSKSAKQSKALCNGLVPNGKTPNSGGLLRGRRLGKSEGDLRVGSQVSRGEITGNGRPGGKARECLGVGRGGEPGGSEDFLSPVRTRGSYGKELSVGAAKIRNSQGGIASVLPGLCLSQPLLLLSSSEPSSSPKTNEALQFDGDTGGSGGGSSRTGANGAPRSNLADEKSGNSMDKVENAIVKKNFDVVNVLKRMARKKIDLKAKTKADLRRKSILALENLKQFNVNKSVVNGVTLSLVPINKEDQSNETPISSAVSLETLFSLIRDLTDSEEYADMIRRPEGRRKVLEIINVREEFLSQYRIRKDFFCQHKKWEAVKEMLKGAVSEDDRVSAEGETGKTSSAKGKELLFKLKDICLKH